MSRVGTEIERANMRARADARQVGRAVYQHQVIESWPGCADCGQPIRRELPDRPAYRTCGCPGRLWRSSADGWVIAWSVMTEEAASTLVGAEDE